MKLKTRITIERDGVEREVEVTGHLSGGEKADAWSLGYLPFIEDVEAREDDIGIDLTDAERERAEEALSEEFAWEEDRRSSQAEDAAEARRAG